jgi:3-deoxy-D-manno-octulosonic acid kinase
LPVPAALPPDYDTWTFDGGYAALRRDVAAAVRHAVETQGSLYRWAGRQNGRAVFHGRGEAYGVDLGGVPAVVRHARRGGAVARLSEDWFFGLPRFLREIPIARELAAAGVATPDVLAGVAYAAGLGNRADVATVRAEGRDLAAVLFGDTPPAGTGRAALLAAVGRLVRHLHDAGYVHPDLQLRNLLVTAGEQTEPAVMLLDVDTCRRFVRSREAERRANLARLFRSWEKWNRAHGARLSAQDRGAFEAGYGGMP